MRIHLHQGIRSAPGWVVPRYKDINWSLRSGNSMSAAEFERLPHALALTQEILAEAFE
jgi:hypothetical protein